MKLAGILAASSLVLLGCCAHGQDGGGYDEWGSVGDDAGDRSQPSFPLEVRDGSSPSRGDDNVADRPDVAMQEDSRRTQGVDAFSSDAGDADSPLGTLSAEGSSDAHVSDVGKGELGATASPDAPGADALSDNTDALGADASSDNTDALGADALSDNTDALGADALSDNTEARDADDASAAAVDAVSTEDSSAQEEGIPLLPRPGDLLITEIMAEPLGPVPAAEWIEVMNPTAEPLVLSGLTLRDDVGDANVIAGDSLIVLRPGVYAILARDRGIAIASGIPADAVRYEYGTGLAWDEGIRLGGASEVALLNGETELVRVPYGGWGLAAPGQSIERTSAPYSDPDIFADWCVAVTPWAPGSDFGTPGMPSDCP